MTERDQLLRAILDAPDDDTPRLVYADKLDELGGKRNAARAEFIRVQVEIARTPQYLSAGVPVTQGVDTGLYGPAAGNDLVVGFSAHPIPNPRHAELRAREIALMKRWYLAWIPASLRQAQEPGYPLHVAFDATVPAGVVGYMRFERGFIAHAGCELSPDVDEHLDPETLTFPRKAVGETARFGRQLRAIFESSPLTGVSLSFEGGGETLRAEITTGTDGVNARYWRVSWDLNTVAQLPRDTIEQPVTLDERAQFGRALEKWLCRAVVAPARAVALTREMETFVPAPDDGLDYAAHHEAMMDAIMNSVAIPPHLAGDEPS